VSSCNFQCVLSSFASSLQALVSFVQVLLLTFDCNLASCTVVVDVIYHRMAGAYRKKWALQGITYTYVYSI
jgi:hypothetical protein